MMEKSGREVDDILRKYGSKIDKELRNSNVDLSKLNDVALAASSGKVEDNYSKSYEQFRSELVPTFSRYERWVNYLGKLIKMKVAEKDRVIIEKNIATAHLNITPSQVAAFAVVILLGGFFLSGLLFAGIWLLTGSFSFLLLFLSFGIILFLFYYAYKTPERLALEWRLKASSQMVPAILYIVIYMKHTSNLEKAIAFTAEHLEPPLSLDFRKIFWDVEVGKFSTIKESLDNYLETWRESSVEFIEAFHLIEGSLYEPSNEQRILSLEKSLQVILDGVYDKMLKYTHEVKSPLTNIYMLGIVLPTLALALIPLASTMLGGAIKWFHLFLLFNVLVPFLVMYMTLNVMMKRPGGYGEAKLLEKNPLYSKYLSNEYYYKSAMIAVPLFLIGTIPFLLRYTKLPVWFGIARDYPWSSIGMGFMGDGGMFGIMTTPAGVLIGPFGMLSVILSLFIPISIALFFSMSYKMKSQELIKERTKYKEVEAEFTSSLSQLGNRMGDGTPAETAFLKVAQSTKGTATEGFFKLVNENVQQLGMSLKEALFNPKRGAVIFYPSDLISTSMSIMLESVKKGLKVAARSMMSISEYVKNIKKIQARMNDLLAELTSDMKSNMSFLAPLLSGIIVGLSGMITIILANLSALFDNADFASQGGLGSSGINQIFGPGGLFSLETMIPTYWLQIAVGIYLVQVVFILTGTLITIKSGKDDLEKTAEIAKNLKSAMLLYFIVSLVAVVGLGMLGAVALQGFLG
jgi:hypothetical protein